MQGGIPAANPAKFVGVVQSYTIEDGGEFDGLKVQYIQITQSLGTSFESGQFSIFVRPLKVEGSVMPTKTNFIILNLGPFI